MWQRWSVHFMVPEKQRGIGREQSPIVLFKGIPSMT
jgi:hypothetical protein